MSLFNGTRIFWQIPECYQSRTDFNKIEVFRSASENRDYSLIATLDAHWDVTGSWVTYYSDISTGNSRDKWYLITLLNSNTNEESAFIIPVKELTPREKRLTQQILATIPDIIQTRLDDNALRQGLLLSLQLFNLQSPETNFNLDNFPMTHEMFLVLGGSVTTLLTRYLTISIRDFNYSVPGGISLTVDRGSKINAAIQENMKIVNQLLKLAKLEFAYDGEGLGTVQLPLSLGGMVSRGIMNLFNVFQVSF
jgi:hypothetical protein